MDETREPERRTFRRDSASSHLGLPLRQREDFLLHRISVGGEASRDLYPHEKAIRALRNSGLCRGVLIEYENADARLSIAEALRDAHYAAQGHKSFDVCRQHLLDRLSGHARATAGSR